MAEVSVLKLVKEFFGMTLKDMKAEWTTLPAKDKAEIESGLRNGTLTY
jgi:hypothetical protein